MLAKKRKPEDAMPASPLAIKLASQIVQNHDSQKSHQEPISRSDLPVATQNKQTSKSLHSKKPKILSRTRKLKESRVMLDQDEWEMKDEIISAIRQATGERVEFSHLMRALLSLSAASIPSIRSNRNHATLPSRPANSDLIGLASFEDELSKFLLIVLRDKKAMDVD